MSNKPAPTLKADVSAAREFAGGGELTTQVARDLEKRIAKAGQSELAAEVRQRRVALDDARAIFSLQRKGGDANDLFQLAESMKQYDKIGYARLLYARTLSVADRTSHAQLFPKVYQRTALCTYKDPDLPLEWKLDRALEILSKGEDLAAATDPETLGLAGAIHKRKWQIDGKRRNLELSLFYYLKGYAQGLPGGGSSSPAEAVRAHLTQPGALMNASKDQGYTGINAAFVLELLAAQEANEARCAGVNARSAAERRELAKLIREEIVQSVPALLQKPGNTWLEDAWWFYATVGEALFGLDRFQEACDWLIDRPKKAGLTVAFGVQQPAGLQVPEWEFESTARQLADLARLRAVKGPGGAGTDKTAEELAGTAAGQALQKVLEGNLIAVVNAFRGKFGLGLSGGGFRASLFHIGVLARLADEKSLQDIEVLSCVSGGSIIGAHYYLELRKLLKAKLDRDIVATDYTEIVQKVIGDFLAGVQRNLRTRVLAELTTNLKLAFFAGYSRTLRLGELYERELFARVHDHGKNQRGKEEGPVTGPHLLPDFLARLFGFRRDRRLLSELVIHPKIADTEPRHDTAFNPRRHNWRRTNKVPILVLNATSLNTGHNWQFTARYMGEPPSPILASIDGNYRLRRLHHESAPRKYPPVRLGDAVAASACVPGLFEPLTLDDLYLDAQRQPIKVQLVDGGVCDNQGTSSLLEQDCSVLFISDGSGQMDAQNTPGTDPLSVSLRSSSILQARVREAQYSDVASRRQSEVLRRLTFVHLKQELSGRSLAWRDCPDDKRTSDFESKVASSSMMSYGIARDTQAKLAGIRTDLDSFCQAEAYALMVSGYKMVAQQMGETGPAVDTAMKAWEFHVLGAAMAPLGPHKDRLDVLLGVASNSVFKAWRLVKFLIVAKWLLAAAAAASVIWLFASHWSSGLVPQSAYEWAKSELTFRSIAIQAGELAAFAALAALINALVGKALGKNILRAIQWRDTLRDIAIGVIMSTVGWLIARFHLHLIDPLYRCYGKAKNFTK